MFEWDPDKAAENLSKHGVSFEEASAVFGDSLALSQPDEEHSEAEPRFRMIGYSDRGRLLVVAYAERGEEIRIVSARRATSRERQQHEE
jgi:hypothetical protein